MTLFNRLLIVDDNITLCQTLVAALQSKVNAIQYCNNIAKAQSTLNAWKPDALILDFNLPDGNALSFLQNQTHQYYLPKTVAISGYAQPQDTFLLAKNGIRHYLQKPFTMEELLDTLTQLSNTPPDLSLNIRDAVGHIGLKDMEKTVRSTMLEEALLQSNDSRRGAARILGISRQMVQHILQKNPFRESDS